jgi:hypothetical protein
VGEKEEAIARGEAKVGQKSRISGKLESPTFTSVRVS